MQEMTAIEHMRSKSMYSGSCSYEELDHGLYAMNHLGDVRMLTMGTMQIFSGFNEIIVNATDSIKSQILDNIQGKKYIHIEIDKDGTIMCKNSGQIHYKETGGGENTISSAFSKLYTSTNHSAGRRINGGTNGIGAKLVNANSDFMEIEVNTGDGRSYRHLWADLVTVKSELVDKPCDCVCVRFKFKFAERGITTEASMNDFIDYCRFRAAEASAYCNIPVTFGSKQPKHTSMVYKELNYNMQSLIQKLYPNHMSFDIPVTGLQYKWQVAVILENKTNYSIVNGTTTTSGTHFNKINKIIKQKLVESKSILNIDDTIINTCMKKFSLLMICEINNASWDSNGKRTLCTSSTQFNTLVLNIKIDQLKLISELAKGSIKTVVKELTDYVPATGKVNRHLFITEGKSANNMLINGLKSEKSVKFGPYQQYIGFVSLGGVPLNVIPHYVERLDSKGNMVKMLDLFAEANEKLNSIKAILGLEYKKTPDDISYMSKMKYDKIVLCFDQDVDGSGKIAPLVVCWLWRSWPELLTNNRVLRFISPIIRVFQKSNLVKQFYYDDQFDDWVHRNAINIKTLTIKYYKGLASHNKSDILNMFSPENFEKHLITYTTPSNTEELLDKYFGSVSEHRKNIICERRDDNLSHIVTMLETRKMPIDTMQIYIEAANFKKCCLKRGIPSLYDGVVWSKRKIINGSFGITDFIMVSAFAGEILRFQGYHQGSVSVEGTIQKMCRQYPQGVRISLLDGDGTFEDIHGNDSGAARYVKARVSKLCLALFRKEDKFRLKYTLCDNEIVEPDYFVPLLPMVAMEMYTMQPSEGWAFYSHARVHTDVHNFIKHLIHNEEPLTNILVDASQKYNRDFISKAGIKIIVEQFAKKWPMRPEKFDCRLEKKGSEYYAVGEYKWYSELNQFHILSLPASVKTNDYKISMHDSEFGLKYIIRELTEQRGRVVIFHMKDGWVDACKTGDIYFTGMEIKFCLYKSLKPNINLIKEDGYLIEFGALNTEAIYVSLIMLWAHKRREYYVKRVQHQIAILAYKLEREKSIIRYLNDTITNSDLDDSILKENGYEMFSNEITDTYETTEQFKLRMATTANYKYLDDLTVRHFKRSSLDDRSKALESDIKKLDALNQYLIESPQCKSLWQQEYDNVKSLLI